MSDSNEPAGLTPLQGIAMLGCVILGTAAFIGIAALLRITPIYAGFLFMLYFGGIMKSNRAELLPALVGALGGLGLAAVIATLPAAFGAAGLAIVALLVLAAIYALLMGWAPILINYAFMLMLTVGTIPAVQARGDYIGMAGAILLGAAFLGALMIGGGVLSRRKAGPQA